MILSKEDALMKKRLFCLLLAMLLPAMSCAEVLGFGFVNDKKVALRRKPGGDIVWRMPKDACVWINDTKTDSKGRLWYQVRSGLNVEHANWDYTGWIRADFVDAGSTVWHDVVRLDAGEEGLIVCRSDGTVETAGRPICSSNWSGWKNTRGWDRGRTDAVDVLARDNLAFSIILQDGRLIASDENEPLYADDPVKLICGDYEVFTLLQSGRVVFSQSGRNANLYWEYPTVCPEKETLLNTVKMVKNIHRVLFLQEDGSVMSAEYVKDAPEQEVPDWSEWTGLTTVSAGVCLVHGSNLYLTGVYAGIREDGTVIAAPQLLRDVTDNWMDMADVCFGKTYVLGLIKDGTVLSAGLDGSPAMDVISWTDIIAIDAAEDWCVGLRRDGTLVFAGDHVFMDEGHERR